MMSNNQDQAARWGGDYRGGARKGMSSQGWSLVKGFTGFFYEIDSMT